MRTVKAIGILNIVFGILFLIAPIKFYLASMKLFTPEVSPPFGLGVIRLITFLLIFPSLILILNGAAFFSLAWRIERVPEIKVFSEAGRYLGRVTGVEIGKEKEIEKFEVEGRTFDKEDVAAVDDVLIVKEEEEIKGPAERHEFVGREVYTTKGVYLGKVESVTLDPDGKPIEFVAVKGTKKEIFRSEDIKTSNDVIIIKSP
jgi:sporulation protein YlmC with PRC-barrel domain